MLQKGQLRPDNNRKQRLPESPEGAVGLVEMGGI